jgi:hypothetical protein
MKKLVLAGLTLVLLCVASLIVFRTIWAQDTSAETREVSKKKADILQAKIDGIKKVDETADATHPDIEAEVSKAELESYVLYSLREKIPAQVDSIDVQLTPGCVGADTQLTFNSNSTGNVMVDSLIGGTHNLFLKGKLAGQNGRGTFDLQEVRVDGIPVPKVLMQTLFDKYVKPKYPDADLKEPFDLPWGIRSIDVQEGKAKIVY